MSGQAASTQEKQQGFRLKGPSVVHTEWCDRKEQSGPPARLCSEPATPKPHHQPDGQNAAEQGQTAPQPFLHSDELIETAHQKWVQRKLRFDIARGGAGPVDLGQPDRRVGDGEVASHRSGVGLSPAVDAHNRHPKQNQSQQDANPKWQPDHGEFQTKREEAA